MGKENWKLKIENDKKKQGKRKIWKEKKMGEREGEKRNKEIKI